MRAELTRVLARDIVLIGIVLKNNQIGQRTNEAPLPNFLFEAQEKQYSVVMRNINILAKVLTQVRLLVTAQPPYVTTRARTDDTLVKPIKNCSLLRLNQKKHLHQHGLPS
jgi:hypothetical protein